MVVRVIMACHNASGTPDFTCVRVQCQPEESAEGRHYEVATAWAQEQGYEGPFVCFDDSDGPAWLFERFDWAAAVVITVADCGVSPISAVNTVPAAEGGAVEALLLALGVRGLVDALAEVLECYAMEGKSLPYDPQNVPAAEAVDPDDLDNAAKELRGNLF